MIEHKVVSGWHVFVCHGRGLVRGISNDDYVSVARQSSELNDVYVVSELLLDDLFVYVGAKVGMVAKPGSKVIPDEFYARFMSELLTGDAR